MANSYIPKWQNISVNFNDANSMMDTAIGGISKAGTVFSKLRDDIAAEEQRAAEAAYKQQVFDENVRQFEAQQAWNRENAEAERKFQIEQAKLADQRARGLVQLRYNLETQAKNKNTAAYNALNTFFMDALKKTNDPVAAAEATRAYHNTNHSNVLFDESKIFGNYADAVAQGYSPENRFLRDMTMVQEGAASGKELAGINKTLKDNFNGYTTNDGFVLQVGANGDMLFVPDSPERKQFLDLQSDAKRHALIEQTAKDRLTALGFGPLESNRILSNIGSQSAIDQESAVLALASRNGVAKPNNIPLANTFLKAADIARTEIADEKKAEEGRKKLFTPEAYSKVYQEVYDEAVKNEKTKDIFNVHKNPELNASIKIIGEAMRKQGKSSVEFKTLLKQIKDHEYSWYETENNDINSKDLSHPVLRAARAEYLPNLIQPEVEGKPEPNKIGNTVVSSTNEGSVINSGNIDTNTTTGSVVTPSTINTTNISEDLKNTDIKLTPRIVKQFKTQRNILQQALKAQDTKDTQEITKRIAYLDAAITNLQNKKAIAASDTDAYKFIKDLLDRIDIRQIEADKAGNPTFTENIDLASRLLRLLETPGK